MSGKTLMERIHDYCHKLEQENETLSAANNDLKKEIRTLKNMLDKRSE